MMEKKDDLLQTLKTATGALAGILVLVVFIALGAFYLFFFYEPPKRTIAATEAVELPTTSRSSAPVALSDGGLDDETGLIVDEGWMLVKTNCTGCHSATLVTQNRATLEGWEGMIRWMQRTQKLWDLGENEAAILDYLEKNYAPQAMGRRPNLAEVEWYELEE